MALGYLLDLDISKLRRKRSFSSLYQIIFMARSRVAASRYVPLINKYLLSIHHSVSEHVLGKVVKRQAESGLSFRSSQISRKDSPPNPGKEASYISNDPLLFIHWNMDERNCIQLPQMAWLWFKGVGRKGEE